MLHHHATGAGGNDTFAVISGSVEITDLNTGDILIVKSGTEVTTKPITSFVATNSTSNSGTVSLTATETGTIDLTLSSSGGYNIISGSSVDNLKGSSGNDTFTIINPLVKVI